MIATDIPPFAVPGSRVLVTGGAGFLGSYLVERLLEEGAGRVVVVDDFSLGRRENLAGVADSPALDVIELDCADLEALQAVCEAESGFDACFNLAVIPLPASLEEPRRTTDANVAMTTSVCEVGRAGLFRRLVQFSSSEVYGTAETAPMPEDHPLHPHTPYAASKAATDHVALSYWITFGLPTTVVRPFNAYGPRQNDKAYAGLIPKVVRDVGAGVPVTIHGDGEQTRDYTHARDVARGTARLAEHDGALGRVFNMGSGREHRVNDLVAGLLRALGEPSWPIVHGPPRPGDVRRLLADVSAARELVGFETSVDIDEGLAQTVAWYREVRG
ncbi:MAG TPA: GDP-mannose 4,6-dehydratase [Solirubrobacteraceae bacterium]|nr:GDP-mannose 4,6-dehydratase [Solirubrobacteraceae bacterium]